MNVDTVDEHTLTRLANVLQTLREMLEDREYDVNQIEWPSVDEVRHWSDLDRLTFALPSMRAENRWILVFFPNEAKIGVGTVRDMIAEMNEAKVDDALVIVRVGLTAAARTELVKSTAVRNNDAGDSGTAAGSKRRRAETGGGSTAGQRARKNVEIFAFDELQTNITLHEWVPPHIVLSKAEKQAVCDAYSVRDDQMPGISAKDPVARYYGLRRGQMVYIVRPSESACTAEYYRIVRT
jgi:DNA-directed RNA polymerase I, II, and III subunit RPABC1